MSTAPGLLCGGRVGGELSEGDLRSEGELSEGDLSERVRGGGRR